MLRRLSARCHADGGFSLPELLVVVTLLAVVGAILSSGLIGGMRATALVQDRTTAMSELQVTVERMSREIRAGAPVQRVTVDGNRSIHVRVFRPGSCERIVYRLEGTELAQYTQPLSPPPPADGSPPNALACASPVVDTPLPMASRRVLLRDLASGTGFVFRGGNGAVLDFGATPRPSESAIRTVELTIRRAVPRSGVVEVRTRVLLRNEWERP